jgi:hypothetical protein
MTVNGDSGTNYSDTALDGDGATAISTRHSSANFFAITNNIGIAGTLGAQTTVIHLQNYSNTTTYKTVLFRANNATSSGYPGATAAVGLWRNTAAITSISLTTASTTFLAGSTFSLYGIANADQGAAKATGGIITEDATYWYHTFGASSAFIPKQSLSCDILQIAGGGGGSAGGGGAGGLLAYSSQSLTAISYNVTVGGGGAAGTSSSQGTNGVNSQFGSLTASVGGGGGGSLTAPLDGRNGGSGGGAGPEDFSTGSIGTATAGQGFNGGTAFIRQSGNGGSGGGGGAGAVGQSATLNTIGNGGIGVATYSSWGLATGTGQNVSGTVYYAGGGGGAGGLSSGGLGGNGGGGNGNKIAGGATAGAVNTGGGGGGPWNTGSTVSGGSGVVIVRYAK